MAMPTDWGVAWGVLGMSRLAHTLEIGDITCKSGAGYFALSAVSDRWRPIIEEALRCRLRPLALPGLFDLAEPRRDEATTFMASVTEMALRRRDGGGRSGWSLRARGVLQRFGYRGRSVL